MGRAQDGSREAIVELRKSPDMATEQLRGSNSDEIRKVRIFPYDGGWAVGWCSGHFAIAYPKEEAIRQAAVIAAAGKLLGVSVTDAEGREEQWLTLESLKA